MFKLRAPLHAFAGKELTFRWLHPISLALYRVMFEEAPSRFAAETADIYFKERPTDELKLMLTEIQLELEEPTQQVRDILDCRASESELREFLRLFAERVSECVAGRSQT